MLILVQIQIVALFAKVLILLLPIPFLYKVQHRPARLRMEASHLGIPAG